MGSRTRVDHRFIREEHEYPMRGDDSGFVRPVQAENGELVHLIDREDDEIPIAASR